MLTCKFLYALDGLYCTSEWRFECYWAQEAKRKRITTKCDEYFFCSTAKNYAWWWYDRFELSFDEIISGFVYFLAAILENQDWCSFIQIWNGLKTTNLLGYEFKLTFVSTGLPLITIMKRRSQTNEFSHKKRLTLNAFNVMYLTNRFVIIRSSSASQCAKIFLRLVWDHAFNFDSKSNPSIFRLQSDLALTFLEKYWHHARIMEKIRYEKRSHKHNVKILFLKRPLKVRRTAMCVN